MFSGFLSNMIGDKMDVGLHLVLNGCSSQKSLHLAPFAEPLLGWDFAEAPIWTAQYLCVKHNTVVNLYIAKCLTNSNWRIMTQ